MSVLLDTNVLFGHHDRDAPRHRVATEAMETVVSGRYGRPIVTDYVYDEVLTLASARLDPESAARLGRRIRGEGPFPAAIDLQFLGPSGFDRTVTLFERLDDQQLSFTDASIVAHVRSREIEYVLSFDDDFDGLVDRLDPASL